MISMWFVLTWLPSYMHLHVCLYISYLLSSVTQSPGHESLPRVAPAPITAWLAIVAGKITASLSRTQALSCYQRITVAAEHGLDQVFITVQAASIHSLEFWVTDFEVKLLLFLPLQRWLRRYGRGLLQLQCRTSLRDAVRCTLNHCTNTR